MTEVITRSPKKRPVEYGMRDYYKYYNKNYPFKITAQIYNNINSELNKFVSEEIVDTAKEFVLPHRTGFIGVSKTKRGVKLTQDGKVINTSPIDWKATNELWNQDEEAKTKKILIRYKNTHTGGYVYKIRYCRYNATFKNKSAMIFNAVRDFNRGIAKRINDYSKEKYNANEIKI